jgi:hypothetical protein
MPVAGEIVWKLEAGCRELKKCESRGGSPGGAERGNYEFIESESAEEG